MTHIFIKKWPILYDLQFSRPTFSILSMKRKREGCQFPKSQIGTYSCFGMKEKS